MSTVRCVNVDADGVAELAASLAPPPPDPAIAERVAATLSDVRERGDAALVDAARAFDCPDFTPQMIRVTADAIAAALEYCDPQLRRALTAAATQIRAFAERSMAPPSVRADLPAGQTITIRTLPVAAAGVYVPGGRAAYPSSLLMAVIPAQVAGVERIAVASPSGPDGAVHPTVLAAAAILGVDEVYAAGGAAAIGAFAYGTDTVAPVDVISGPGSAWVAEAKRQVYGRVGIDSVAGPSEVVILAEGPVDAAAIAADLLAQAEHGPDSPAILATTDATIIEAVTVELGAYDAVGAITLVQCEARATAEALAEAFAPEHLQIDTPDAAQVAQRIRHAGAVFLGPNGATAFGDYVAGSNHILPTGRAARYASALSAATYMRRMSIVDMSDDAVRELTPYLATIAAAEGFPHHRRSAELRLARIERTDS